MSFAQGKCADWCCGGGGKVPVWRKLTYAVGSMQYSMTTGVIGFYFAVFLLEVVIVSIEKNLLAMESQQKDWLLPWKKCGAWGNTIANFSGSLPKP